jgi:hypothetical protein
VWRAVQLFALRRCWSTRGGHNYTSGDRRCPHSLESLRKRIIDAGQPGHLLKLSFARLLRDAVALVAALRARTSERDLQERQPSSTSGKGHPGRGAMARTHVLSPLPPL